MCGACTTVEAGWADAVLRTAYGRTVTAKLVNRLAPRLTVRPSAAGWTVADRGSARMRLCEGSDRLAVAVRAPVERMIDADPTAAVRDVLLAAPPHRPLECARGEFPSAHVGRAPAADPVPPDRVIPHVLALSLTSHLPGAEEGVVLHDTHGPWLLRAARR